MHKLSLLLTSLIWTSFAGRIMRPSEKKLEEGAGHRKLALAQFLFAQNAVARGAFPNRNSVRMSRPSVLMQAQDDDKRQAWLEMLDALTKATEAMNEVSQKAADFAALDAQCVAGDEQACEVLSREEDAKRKWLAKLEAPAWRKSPAAISSPQASATTSQVEPSNVPQASSYMDSLAPATEEEAKRKWLAQQEKDKPSWGRGATSSPPASATTSQAEAQASSYMDSLASSAEQEAKKRWLAKQEQNEPAWRKRR